MGRQKNRGACADRLRGRAYLRPFNLMRIMPPEEVINDFFTEAPDQVPSFFYLLERRSGLRGSALSLV